MPSKCQHIFFINDFFRDQRILTLFLVHNILKACDIKGKGSPYSITEQMIPELIPVLGSQPADEVINPAVGCHYFPPGLQLPSQPLRGLLPMSLLGEQRHDEYEQFA